MPTKISNARLSFPGLFKATPFKPGDEPKFKATFLVPKGSAQEAAIEAAIKEVATAKWGKKADAILKSIRGNPNKFCFQDGDSRDYDGYAGMMALSAKNAVRPAVIDKDTTPLVEADGRPYAGCMVDASVEFFCYDNSGNGVSCSLRWVQFRGDGDAFSGGAPVSQDEFEAIADGAQSDDLV